MNVGTLDRQITLQRSSITGSDAVGGSIIAWATLQKVWSRVVPMSGSESLRLERQVSSETSRFFIRYFAGLTVKDRISYDGKLWDIQNIRELGRKESLEILAEVVK